MGQKFISYFQGSSIEYSQKNIESRLDTKTKHIRTEERKKTSTIPSVRARPKTKVEYDLEWRLMKVPVPGNMRKGNSIWDMYGEVNGTYKGWQENLPKILKKNEELLQNHSLWVNQEIYIPLIKT